MEKKNQSIIGISCFATIFLPLFFLKSHHNCEYDKCFRVYYDGRLGMCVEKAINDMYFFIAVFWCVIIYGSALIISKSTNSISPFVVISLVLLISIYGALIDPSKWLFVISLFPSVILFVIARRLDKE